MEFKELIESGKLELYAMGVLEGAELHEVEQALQNSPELREEYDSIVDALQAYGDSQSENAPTHILNQALAKIENDESASKVEPEPAGITVNLYKWLSVAASVLLVASVFLNYKLSSDLKEVRTDYLALKDENSQMAVNRASLKAENSELNTLIAAISDPSAVRTDMASTEAFPDHQGSIYWNKESSDVILAKADVPHLSDNEQYQLWAIVDGTPVDAGVFDAGDTLIRMKDIEGDAVAFAVTIEPKGGSAEPTLEKMCMLGNVPMGNS